MNSFGSSYRISIYGESHGAGVGVVLDGVIPGIPLSEEDFFLDLARRKPGAKGTTPRIEKDIPEILSGVHEGHTTGAPINIFFRNSNTESKVYRDFKSHPRPGHAD
ncbi:MAG: chorismate synthase, partial [Fusobacteriaceae bacterium]